jgi:hypothetical protein
MDTNERAYQQKQAAQGRVQQATQDLAKARTERRLSEALESRAAQASPALLERVRVLRAAGKHDQADYWLAKALRLNTRRGIREVTTQVRYGGPTKATTTSVVLGPAVAATTPETPAGE